MSEALRVEAVFDLIESWRDGIATLNFCFARGDFTVAICDLTDLALLSGTLPLTAAVTMQ